MTPRTSKENKLVLCLLHFKALDFGVMLHEDGDRSAALSGIAHPGAYYCLLCSRVRKQSSKILSWTGTVVKFVSSVAQASLG